MLKVLQRSSRKGVGALQGSVPGAVTGLRLFRSTAGVRSSRLGRDPGDARQVRLQRRH